MVVAAEQAAAGAAMRAEKGAKEAAAVKGADKAAAMAEAARYKAEADAEAAKVPQAIAAAKAAAAKAEAAANEAAALKEAADKAAAENAAEGALLQGKTYSWGPLSFLYRSVARGMQLQPIGQPCDCPCSTDLSSFSSFQHLWAVPQACRSSFS